MFSGSATIDEPALFAAIEILRDGGRNFVAFTATPSSLGTIYDVQAIFRSNETPFTLTEACRVLLVNQSWASSDNNA